MKFQFKNTTAASGARLILLGIITLSTSAWAQLSSTNLLTPTPYIDNILPASALVHGPGFPLSLRGSGFRPGAEVEWRVGFTTLRLAAVVANGSELLTWVPSLLTENAGTATVTVIDPRIPFRLGKSNPVFLPITVPTSSVAFNQRNITVGTKPYAIVTADFNGDGKLDFAISQPCGADPTCATFNGSVTVYLGNGNGTFTATPPVAVDQFPGAMAVGDFNGDGKPDLAVVTFTGYTVTILLGRGDGTFRVSPFSSAVGVNPNSIVAGDLNGDGQLDLAVSNFGSSSISVLFGNGDGSFTPGPSLVVGSEPLQVFLGDINGDGRLDLVAGTSFTPYIAILLGDGHGNFTPLAPPSTTVGLSGLADVNRDGKLDLVVAFYNSPGFGQTAISVLTGNGDGTFSAGPTSPVVNSGILGGIIADLNGDKKLDFAGAVFFPSNSYDFLLGDGSGTFTLTNSIDVSNNGNGPAVVGDFNGDGRLDLATINGMSNMSSGTVSILLQDPPPL